MKCDDARDLIHLNRPGERTEDEERILEAHLRTCSHCAAEAQRVRDTRDQLDLLIRTPVPAVHTAREVRAIMDRLTGTRRPARSTLDVFLGFASRPSVRLAYAVLSLATVAVMGMQLAGLRTSTAAPEPTAGPYIAYTISTEPLSQLASLPVPETIKASVRDRSTLSISKEDLDKSARLAGQAMLHSLSMTRQQRQLAEMIITSLRRSSELTVRLGKIGG